jgi:Na+-transporting methylmalonyl-CoA/oxaloacetate decarboxylase gamma subunit
MKAVLLFMFILIMMSSCGYRIGTHSTKTNLTAWKAEKEAKKKEKEAKREEDKKYLKH